MIDVSRDRGLGPDDLPDGLVVADADRRVTECNRAALEMLGMTEEPVLGRPIDDVVALDNQAGRYWFDCHRPYGGLATRTRLTEGSWFTASGAELLVTARMVRDAPRGRVVRLVVSLRDAKPRARLDRERSELVATVAHELRSPLTGVKGFTSTLLRKWDRFSDEQRQFMLETVDADADRLSRLISELLDAARLDAGRLSLRTSSVDMSTVVSRVLESVSVGRGQQLHVDGAASDVRVWGDEDRLIQVITNLVENAFTHGQGLTTVTVREPDDGRDGVIVAVSDRGPGIPEDRRNRIFNRFWKGGAGAGSGLGLYIVKGIIEQHHGTVEVADSPEGGTTIRVWLPVNEPEGVAG